MVRSGRTRDSVPTTPADSEAPHNHIGSLHLRRARRVRRTRPPYQLRGMSDTHLSFSNLLSPVASRNLSLGPRTGSRPYPGEGGGRPHRWRRHFAPYFL